MAQQDDEFVSTAMTADRYVSTMLSSVEGHKVLLVDDAVRAIFNAITTHSSLLSHSVLLVDKIFNPDRQPMKYMPAIAILRPTADSMAAISREIRAGTFREFHLFFTNLVLTEHLQSIANCDDGGLVKRVEEVFLDFTPVTENSVVIPLKREFSLEGGKTVLKPHIPLTINQWSPGEINRVVEGLVATMLACQRRPTIRYRRGSQIAARLASELSVKMKTVNSVFFDLRRHSTVLLILDRMDDPVTPLLTQWTYEAMMHEHFGINDGVVDLGGGTNETKHVLSKHHDSFWSSHRDKVWGELCVAVKNLVEAYKKAGSIDVATASLQDIEAFMAKFPQFKKDNAVMTRHASIAHKLGALVQERALIDLSTIEQELANNNAPNDHARLVLDCIRSLKGETVDTTVTNEDTGRGVATSSKAALSPERPESDYLVCHDDAVKLVILYSLRYEKVAKAEPLVAEMKSVLRSRGATDAHLDLIRKFLEYSSVASRIAPLYKNQTNLLKTMVKTIAGFGSDVQNVFTSHVPLMKKFVCQAFNGTLLTDDFPIQEVSGISSVSNSLGRANDIIVFYAGGATYEEAVLANNINLGKAENDSSTFPQTDSMLGAGAVGVVGNALGAAVKGLVKAAGTQGADDVVGPATAIPEAPPKFLTCKVTLVSNGMLRQREFMASVGAL